MKPNPLEIPRFIVGMSRAGTNWLSKSLNEHSDVAVFGETLFWGRGFVQPKHGRGYTSKEVMALQEKFRMPGFFRATIGEGPGCLKHVTEQNLPRIIDDAFSTVSSPISPGELFLHIAKAIATAEGKLFSVEKTPHHVLWIDRILEELPNARFVVMIRDPYEFMLSYKHQGDRKPPAVKRMFKKMYHPLGAALVWRGYMRASNAAVRHYAEQVLLVNMGEIRRNPQDVSERVQRFFLLEPVVRAEQIPPDNSSFPNGSKSELRNDDVFWMNIIGKKEMNRFRFKRRPTPTFMSYRITMSIIRLPFWVLWTLNFRRKIVEMPLLKYLLRWLHPPNR